jgi:hypothetical protein
MIDTGISKFGMRVARLERLLIRIENIQMRESYWKRIRDYRYDRLVRQADSIVREVFDTRPKPAR